VDSGFNGGSFDTNGEAAAMLTAVNVLNYGARGDGVTDDTVAFQAAIATQKPVWVPSHGTNGYLLGNLVLTNGSGLISSGARLIFNSSSNGWFILLGTPDTLTNCPSCITTTNPVPNSIMIDGLELDGGSGLNTPSSVGTRNGLWLDCYGTNICVRNCYVHGFSGIGVLAQSYRPNLGVNWPNSTQDDQPIAKFSNCTAEYNGIGIKIGGELIDAAFSGGGNVYDAEYMTGAGFNCAYNFIGWWQQGANCNFSSCTFARNTINVTLYNSSNNRGAAHGSFSGCSINHSAGGINGVVATNITTGYEFTGCNFWFNGIMLTNCTGIRIIGGTVENQAAMYCAGTSSNNSFIDTLSPDNLSGILQYGSAHDNFAFLNYSFANNQFDTMPLFSSPAGIWPPTYNSLKAVSTNCVWMFPSNSVPPHWWFGHFDASSNVVYDGHMP
jgi:hypothetical protein